MTLQDLASALSHHYQELGYIVGSTYMSGKLISLISDERVHEIKFFTHPPCEWVASLYLNSDGIICDTRTCSMNNPPPLYDYADPRLIDQLDQLIADSYNGIPK